jgi:predicted MFS family arabinose efflux permease
MGLINGGALIGPALGPVLGGILAAFLGWRSIFWFLAIFAGVLLVLLLMAFPETSRNVVGNGSIAPQRWNRDLLSVLRARRTLARAQTSTDENKSQSLSQRKDKKRRIRMPNPLATLKILKEKDVGLLLLYNCLVYASYFSVTSSLPYLFAQKYGFNDLQIGLSYLPYGVGALLASLFNGRILDWRFRKVAESIGIEIIKGQAIDTRNFPLERVRLPIAFVLIVVGNSALLCYGWVCICPILKQNFPAH